MNIPDAVGVETGWRTWKIGSDGLLHSCSYDAAWQPGEPLQATCKTSQSAKKWVATSIEDAIESGDPLSTAWSMPNRDEDGDYEAGVRVVPPRTLLPPDMAYAWRVVTHDCPSESCTCGIYVASDPSGCRGYGKYVIGRVSLWGRVVPGTSGFRGELAYPSELYLLTEPMPENERSLLYFSFSLAAPEEPKPDEDEALAVLGQYGVPVQTTTYKKLCRLARPVRDASRPAHTADCTKREAA